MFDHTFVICAYKESIYLEECIMSLKKQKLASEIILTTSTPNDLINDIAKKYKIKCYVNDDKSSITGDWNFGLSKVKTRYATIAHQDDIYTSEYLIYVRHYLRRSHDPIIVFTDYGELRNGNKADDSKMLKVKRMMLAPLRVKKNFNSKFVRRRILSMGNPICCPSVTYCMDKIVQPLFSDHFLSNEDWEAWEKLSKSDGAFIYIPRKLIYHRIHEDSTTSKIIALNKRIDEDYEMFRKFWPKRTARFIGKIYAGSERFNTLKD